jgi:hypothetical protein
LRYQSVTATCQWRVPPSPLLLLLLPLKRGIFKGCYQPNFFANYQHYAYVTVTEFLRVHQSSWYYLSKYD